MIPEDTTANDGAHVHALLLLGISLLCWGCWPFLRQLCGAPVGGFCTLNIGAQFATSLFYLLVMWLLRPDATKTAALQAVQHPTLRELAVFTGGWLLGHADHLSSIAMQYIPAGIAYPLYAGVALVLAQVLNVLQLGSPNPSRLCVGLGLVLAGLCFLALTQSQKNVGGRSPEREHVQVGVGLLGQSKANVQQQPPSQTGASVRLIKPGPAMLMCLVAGVCGSGWSPLSTFARAGRAAASLDPVHMPCVCLVIFEVGQLCAIPSVALLGGRLTHTTWYASLQDLGWPNTLAGILCGVGVASGYAAYFYSSTRISPAIAFGIVCCNPILALIIDILRCKFRGSSCILKVYLGLSLSSYLAAIFILASIPASSDTDGSGSTDVDF